MYVGVDENLKTKYDLDVQNENNITTVRVYYQNNDVSTSLVGKLLSLTAIYMLLT
ncbi:MAG: hypothetical protein IPP56_01855 [Bacteroidetes bacterium]|nr:hypothetical protein [Bacteroidota bacterium]